MNDYQESLYGPPWGPSGEIVYERTYRREKPNGEKEVWAETVDRVITGNLSLVYGPKDLWSEETKVEYRSLYALMYEMKILPAGRHLWASGVPGRQYLFNCHVSGWDEKFSTHFEFTFMRLMEGGGVGANYSTKYVGNYDVLRTLNVHIVCDPSHPDYQEMKDAGLLSTDYSSDWNGAWEVEDSREGWASALVDLLDTYITTDEVKHENRVYDVTNVRCKGSRLKTFGGTASGPLPFALMLREISDVLNNAREWDWGAVTPMAAMEIDHAIAKCVVSGGNRRSARMAMVHWRDPYVFDFIDSKADGSKHWTTNISVEIDDEFTDALQGKNGWHLEAQKVHEAVVKGNLLNGEPGYWNSDLSNVGEVSKVVCTNPCGEIPLSEWEACNLGHVNLDAFAPTVKGGHPDGEALLEAHVLMTRFLMRATFGDINDPKQVEVQNKNRRIGVGHFGVQGFLAKCGIRYSDAPGTTFIHMLDQMRQVVRNEARHYAFDLRIPEPVKVTTVAPTGTIAKLAGRTEGIHPIFSRYFIRRIRFSTASDEQFDTVMDYYNQGYVTEQDNQAANTWIVQFPTKEALVQEVEDMGYDPSIVESADEISFEHMLRFQAMYQTYYADNAVSFTVNVPDGTLSLDEAMGTLAKYLPLLKGTTIFPDKSREQAPYERITEAEYQAAVNKSVADGVDENCSNGACPVR